MAEEEIVNEEVKIAEKDIRIYLGECALRFQSKDQLILSAGHSFVEKMRYVANILNAMGIVIDKKYKHPATGKMKFEEQESEIINPKTGRKEIRNFYKLGITKIPEIYMYTDPDKAIDYPELKER